MKRLIQRFVKWLYAEGIEIQVDRAIEAQFNERFRFSLMQYRLQGDGVGGTVPYWRYNAENPAVIHRFTCATLQRLSRTGFQNFEVK